MLYSKPIFKNQQKKKEPRVTPLKDQKVKSEYKRFVKVNDTEEEELIKEGRREGIKELAKQEVEELPKIEALKRMKDRELMRIKTVFPFVFFSDYLIVEENKLTFVWSVFFWSKDIRSILLKDISNVTLETGLFFAKINVIDRYFAKDNMEIEYLPKEKALEARRLIQGLIVSIRENIDYSDIPKHEVIKHAMKLGEADTKS